MNSVRMINGLLDFCFIANCVYNLNTVASGEDVAYHAISIKLEFNRIIDISYNRNMSIFIAIQIRGFKHGQKGKPAR